MLISLQFFKSVTLLKSCSILLQTSVLINCDITLISFVTYYNSVGHKKAHADNWLQCSRTL